MVGAAGARGLQERRASRRQSSGSEVGEPGGWQTWLTLTCPGERVTALGVVSVRGPLALAGRCGGEVLRDKEGGLALMGSGVRGPAFIAVSMREPSPHACKLVTVTGHLGQLCYKTWCPFGFPGAAEETKRGAAGCWPRRSSAFASARSGPGAVDEESRPGGGVLWRAGDRTRHSVSGGPPEHTVTGEARAVVGGR